MTVDLLVVGGGPAALAAARAYRDAGGAGAVLLLSDDTAPPYERPALSKDYLRGGTEESALPLEDAGFYTGRGIELALGEAVTGLDPTARTVTLAGGRVLDYQTCVLATGGASKPLPVPGADDPEVRQLRSVASARELRSAAASARTAVVVGSGFIGCEVAASLAVRGLRVTQVTDEAVPQAGRLGADAGGWIAGWLRGAGVRLRTDSAVGSVAADRVVLAGGEEIAADLVLMAAGMRPRAELAEAAGVRVRDGRVLVDEHMRTGVDGLLAAGDLVRAFNAAAGRHLAVEHWGEALAMGEVAGTTAAGGEASWAQAPGFWSGIGDRVLKYVAWGDGWDSTRPVEHGGGAFTVWYGRDGVTVGVLTHEADDDHERGRELVEQGRPLPL